MMSQKASKWLGSMAYFTDPYKWAIPWGGKNPTDPITIDPFTSGTRDIQVGFTTWRIIPVSKWLITMVSIP